MKMIFILKLCKNSIDNSNANNIYYNSGDEYISFIYELRSFLKFSIFFH